MTASYAAHRARFHPGSMGAALAINGGVLAALLLAAPEVLKSPDPRPFEIKNIELPQPPPPPEPTPEVDRVADPMPMPNPSVPDPVIPPLPNTNTMTTTLVIPPFPPPPLPPDFGNGTAEPGPIAEPALPSLLAATRDPRYARDFQPDYPSAERRAQREGSVTLRVRIGIDGRVKQVERVAAASEGFYDATRRQALSSWRFRPATRGDVPVESWQTLTVRFVLES